MEQKTPRMRSVTFSDDKPRQIWSGEQLWKSLEDQSRWLKILEKQTSVILHPIDQINGYITKIVHHDNRCAIFTFYKQNKNLLFFYRIKDELREHESIFQESDLFLEIWEYSRLDLPQYRFVRTLIDINSLEQ